MASPRLMSKLAREQEMDMESRGSNVKLSARTSSRLAELRARRAAQEEDDFLFQPSPRPGGESNPRPVREVVDDDSEVGSRNRPITDEDTSSSRRREPISEEDTSAPSPRRRPITYEDTSHNTRSRPINNADSQAQSSPRRRPITDDDTSSSRQRADIDNTDSHPSPRRRGDDVIRESHPSPRRRGDDVTSESHPSPRRRPMNDADLSASLASRRERLEHTERNSPRASPRREVAPSSGGGGATGAPSPRRRAQVSPTKDTSSSTHAPQSAAAPTPRTRTRGRETVSPTKEKTPPLSADKSPTSPLRQKQFTSPTSPKHSQPNKQPTKVAVSQQIKSPLSPTSNHSNQPDTQDLGYQSKYSRPLHAPPSSGGGLTRDVTSGCREYTADYSADRDVFNGPRSTPTRNAGDMDDDDSVGFSSLPEQVHRKALKRGFDFTLMVVGESGLGKSTLMQSLFLNTDLYNDRTILPVHERLKKTVQIEKRYMEIEERGVKLRLTIVDTPGYNDSLTAEDGWKPVENYIDQQFDQYFQDESGLNRKNIKDNRVHCCLYFISPFGHGLRMMDIHFMKRLHHKVNIVPIIAKADTLTQAEIWKMKAHIMDQIANNDIHIYEFPDCDSDEDEDFKRQDQELKASIPFSVIGSNTIVEVNGKKIRGRLYPWGIVDVDNSSHCDFTKLRQMLISTHMQDLKDVTRDVHYENFRAQHITEQMSKQAAKERNPHLFDKNLRVVRSNSKLKRDSSPNFESIVQTDALLQQKDEEIKRMQQMLISMQHQLQNSPQKNRAQLNGTVVS